MKRILIVEDDRALGDGLCLALRDPALELTLCRSLSAARSALEAGDFALVILDVNLPDGSGLDLLRRPGGIRSPWSCSPPTTWRRTSWPGWSPGRTTM